MALLAGWTCTWPGLLCLPTLHPKRSLTGTQMFVVLTAVSMLGTLAVTLAGSVLVKRLITARCTGVHGSWEQ
jgi:hypothetical protein